MLIATFYRLLCAAEGTYLVQEETQGVMEEKDDFKEKNETDFVKFSCEMPITSGRGFMEVSVLSLSCSAFYLVAMRSNGVILLDNNLD